MKSNSLLLALVAALPVAAQTPVTVTTAPGNAEQTWYALLTDATTSAPLDQWDLAFEINGGFNAGILVNTQKGDQVFLAPYAVSEWSDLDTNGLAASWPALHNSDTAWSRGALNNDVDLDAYNLGWGQYNVVTHVVAGDSIYVLGLADGSWLKLRIDALSAGTYTFTYADLDGANEQTQQIAKSSYLGKNFGYWSFSSGSALDREPPSAEWDLLFGKYTTDLGIWYGVTGVLQNKNVQVVRVAGVPPAEAQMDWDLLSSEINTIGYDWKSFDMNSLQYVLDDSVTYFVKDVPGNIWKVVFTAFGGGATGDISFTKELISATSVADVQGGSTLFQVYPNPTVPGPVRILVDAPEALTVWTICDVNGQVLRSGNFRSAVGLTMHELDASGLSAGAYVVRAQGGENAYTTRLIIQ